MVLLALAYTPVTPTCSTPPFSIVGWSITREHNLRTCLSPSLPHNSVASYFKNKHTSTLTNVYEKVWNCGSRVSTCMFHSLEVHQSQNLLLTQKRQLSQPCGLSTTVYLSHLQLSPKQGGDSTRCKYCTNFR